MQCVTLAESQVIKSVGELGLLVDQAWGWRRRAAGKKSGVKSHGKNE
jgi:hypothetical protein